MTEPARIQHDSYLADRARTEAPLSVEPFVGLLDREILDAQHEANQAIHHFAEALKHLARLPECDTRDYVEEMGTEAQGYAEQIACALNETLDKGWSREGLRDAAE